jgi:hypothetical protein
VTDCINGDVDFGTYAATRTTEGFILNPPFAPAACWCARTMVASIMTCSKSGSSAKTLKWGEGNPLMSTGPSVDTVSRELPPAARTLGLKLHVLHASNERDFDTVFATLVQLRAGGLVISSDFLFTGQIEQLAALTVRHALPTIYEYREFAAAGGLMSYVAVLPTRTVLPVSTPAAFSKARSRPTCRFSRQPRSS